MNILFLRRAKLGLGSLRGMTAYLNGVEVDKEQQSKYFYNLIDDEYAGYVNNTCLNQFRNIIRDDTLLIRWGCTSGTEKIFPLDRQINKSEAIKTVSNKKEFRRKCQYDAQGLVPYTIFKTPDVRNDFEFPTGLIVRPSHHAQGKNLWVVYNKQQLDHCLHKNLYENDWYASQIIDKIAEFRVYVVNGRVATVAQKTPGNPEDIAWNVAQGGRFDVLKWGEWNMEVCRVAIESMKLSGLDFGGVDVMIDKNGKAYQIEINSAPSLPLIRGGKEISYRQKCMAKCFRYIYEYSNEWINVKGYNSWKDVIHPAIQMYERK